MLFWSAIIIHYGETFPFYKKTSSCCMSHTLSPHRQHHTTPTVLNHRIIYLRFRNYDPLTTRMFSIYLNDENELIGRHGDLYADYIVPKEVRVRDLCVKTFNHYRMESECTLVCANGRVPNGDGKFYSFLCTA